VIDTPAIPIKEISSYTPQNPIWIPSNQRMLNHVIKQNMTARQVPTRGESFVSGKILNGGETLVQWTNP
jgi:hypothetical protein